MREMVNNQGNNSYIMESFAQTETLFFQDPSTTIDHPPDEVELSSIKNGRYTEVQLRWYYHAAVN